MELHAQAAERTLRAVVAPEAPAAKGRGGAQRLRPRERGGSGAEARAGGKVADTVRALAAGAAIGAKVLTAEWG